MESPQPPEVSAWRRHALTLRRFWGTALASQGEYRVNLWIELLATAGNLAGSLFVLSLLYRPGRGLGGWSWEAALVRSQFARRGPGLSAGTFVGLPARALPAKKTV